MHAAMLTGAWSSTARTWGRRWSGSLGAGNREYEWGWTVAPAALATAVAALGGGEGEDPLRAMRSWSAAHPGKDPGSFLKEAGVPIGFWNRVGD